MKRGTIGNKGKVAAEPDKQAVVEALLGSMGFEHPVRRGRDHLDFKDVAVWTAADVIRIAIAVGAGKSLEEARREELFSR